MPPMAYLINPISINLLLKKIAIQIFYMVVIEYILLYKSKLVLRIMVIIVPMG